MSTKQTLDATDEALIEAATRVVTADNRTRWVASWIADDNRADRQAEMVDALAALRALAASQAVKR
jgi:hypothetical protein